MINALGSNPANQSTQTAQASTLPAGGGTLPLSAQPAAVNVPAAVPASHMSSIPDESLATKSPKFGNQKQKGVGKMLLGFLFLIVLIIGSVAVYFLSQNRQDIRNQASVTTYAGCTWQTGTQNGDINSPGAYTCRDFSTCWRCNNGVTETVEFDDTLHDSHCPEPCKSNACDAASREFDYKTQCRKINAAGCGYFCGGNRDGGPCEPGPSDAGGDQCIYNGKAYSCVCLDLIRCECDNGVWVTGSNDQSCATLCACTGNVCTSCGGGGGPSGVPNPTEPPNPTSPPAGPQCTTVTIMDANGVPLTGDQDKNLKAGVGVKFKCGANGTVAKYEFQVVLPDGKKEAVAATGDISAIYVLPSLTGRFYAQCRICTSVGNGEPGSESTCQDYEPITP